METILFSSYGDNTSSLMFGGLQDTFIYNGFKYAKIEYHRDADIIFDDRSSYSVISSRNLNPDKKLVNHNRFPKYAYAELFKRAAKDLKSKHFISVPHHRGINSFEVKANSTYLLKPNFSANGDFMVELNKNISLYAQDKIVNLFLNEKTDLEQFKKELETNEIKHTIHSNNEKEIRNVFNCGYSIVEVIPNVIEEYRILTNYRGEFSCIAPRTLDHAGLNIKQATLVVRPLTDISYKADHYLDKAIASEVSKLIAHLKMPLHSFDLFITQDGKFGFFEASNEFGLSNAPNGWLHEQSMKFIDSIRAS